MLTRWIAVVMLAVLVAGFGLATALIAQEDNSPVSLDLKDADFKSAIESLFRGRNRNYSIGQDVAGVIPSLSISGVPFDQALKSLLKTAGLVYRVENSVYIISKKPETSAMAIIDTSAALAADTSAVDTTTTVESRIEKVGLYNTGASEILGIMQGSGTSGSGSYGSGYGMMGGMGGGMGGYGMMGGMGGGMGGYGGGGGGYGGGGYGGGGYGGGGYGGYGGGSNRGSYGGGGYGGGGYGGGGYGGGGYGGGRTW